MKIAFVHHNFVMGSGIEGVIYELAKRLGKEHKVTVFTFNNEYPDSPNFEIREVKIPFRKNRVMNAVVSPLLLHKVLELRGMLKGYDVVNTHLYPANLFPIFPRKLNGVLNVVTEWGVQPADAFGGLHEKAYIWLLKRANNYAVRHADIVLAGCNDVKRRVKQECGVKARKVFLYGVDFGYFNKDIDTEPIYERHPELRDAKVLLYVGRASPHKNIDLLIKSLKILKESVPKAKLVVVGRQDFAGYSMYLERLAFSAGLGGDVIFTGFVSREDLPRYYAVCDVFVVASPWEGYLIPEPLAMAKPMIAYNAPPHRETIRQGVNGLLVKELTPEAFAEAEYCLLVSNSMGKEMGKTGYSWAKKHLDYDIIAKNFLDVIKEGK